MSLDALGVIMTRQAFDSQSNLTSLEGNLYRCFGAVFVFIFISFFKPIDFFKNLKKMPLKPMIWLNISVILGTFLSLTTYLKAIQISDQLASITALSVTSVLFSLIFESIYNKKLPGQYFWAAFLFFLLGMKFVL